MLTASRYTLHIIDNSSNKDPSFYSISVQNETTNCISVNHLLSITNYFEKTFGKEIQGEYTYTCYVITVISTQQQPQLIKNGDVLVHVTHKNNNEAMYFVSSQTNNLYTVVLKPLILSLPPLNRGPQLIVKVQEGVRNASNSSKAIFPCTLLFLKKQDGSLATYGFRICQGDIQITTSDVLKYDTSIGIKDAKITDAVVQEDAKALLTKNFKLSNYLSTEHAGSYQYMVKDGNDNDTELQTIIDLVKPSLNSFMGGVGKEKAKATKERIKVGSAMRVVYVGPRGGHYIRKNGKLVPLSSL